jgi:hypothetical protein
MPEGLIERIVAESGVADLVEILSARLAPTDLQSLMLEVYRRRAAAVTPHELLRRYEADRFCRPGSTAPEDVSRFESLAWSLLPDGFVPVDLSPVSPLGTSSVVATVDQHKVVSTVRNTEVMSDSTGVLTLEAARRRRATPGQAVHLIASNRLMRAQKFDVGGAHFRLIGLVSAGRSAAFERASLITHIDYLTRLILSHDPTCRPEVTVTDLLDRGTHWAESLDLPGVDVRMDPDRRTGRGYYRDTCFRIHTGGVELADGGGVDWTARLLSNAKERLVISGLGIERLLVPPT